MAKPVRNPFLILSACLATAAALGFLVWRRRHLSRWDSSFTGAFPRGSGAVSAVTGGPPEDMNGMPATPDPHREGTIYDGSDLEHPRANDRRKEAASKVIIGCP
jgi:hypothetical protein